MANLLRTPWQLPAHFRSLLPTSWKAADRGSRLASGWFRSGLGGALEQGGYTRDGANPFEKLLREIKVSPKIEERDVIRIPASGPLLVAANHPYGFLESAVLAALLLNIRPDVRILAQRLIPPPPLLEEFFLFLEPFETSAALWKYSQSLPQAVQWLRSGGALITFPSREVSCPDWRRRSVADGEWSPAIARLIRLGAAVALPAYVSGSNSAGFHLLGLVHPSLRTRRLPTELLNKRGLSLEVRLGRPVDCAARETATDGELMADLRARTYLLSRGLRHSRPRSARPEIPVTPPTSDAETIARMVESMPESAVLLDQKDWKVVCFPGASNPVLLDEIGRLREITFRAAGEGTGRARDVDRFDATCDQLVLWSKKNQEIAGGYRLARSADVLARRGIEGLYTASLFRYRPAFFERLGPGIELGRSFVSIPYQKQFTPLLALWQGIGAYVCQRPECRILFGPVSISAAYQPLSRSILASSLLAIASDPALAALVEPRVKLRQDCFPGVGRDWQRLIISDLEELNQIISDLEPDGKGIPVLLRQYLRLGGRLLAFSVDHDFSGALDGLVVVDLLQTDPPILDRYMTKPGAAGFRRYHAAASPPLASFPEDAARAALA